MSCDRQRVAVSDDQLDLAERTLWQGAADTSGAVHIGDGDGLPVCGARSRRGFQRVISVAVGFRMCRRCVRAAA